MATPSQWDRLDDVTYAEPIHGILYTTPVFQNHTTTQEPLYCYAESGNPQNVTYQNTNCHRTNFTSEQNSELLYASIQKSKPTSTQRAIQNALSKNTELTLQNPYQNYNPKKVEDTYAQVQKNRPNSKNYDQFPSDIVSKSHYENTSNLDGDKTPASGQPYENVRDLRNKEPKYENADVKNEVFVEPAYSEVINKHMIP